jgi:hypothetical protein
MSITIKKIGGREYAYEAFRRGRKIIQNYLGSVNGPDVTARIKALEKNKSIPSGFLKYFWDVDPHTLNIRRHSRFIIERVLELGDLKALWWTQKQYPTSLIIEVCRTSRRLSQRSRHFWIVWFGENHVS